MRVSDDALIDVAGEVFLGAIQTAIPGVGDEEQQLGDRHLGAIDLWLFNGSHGLSHLNGDELLFMTDTDNSRRIPMAVESAIAAIKDYAAVAKPSLVVDDPSCEVVSQLAACVRLLLFYSSPVKNETATDLFKRLRFER